MNITEAINNSLFFFGAGSSVDSGCKTSKQMLGSLRYLCSEKNQYLSEIEKEALKFLFSCIYYHSQWRGFENSCFSALEPNIEELALLIRRIQNRENFLPYPITGNWADKLVKLESEYKENQGKETGLGLFENLENKLKTTLLPEWLKVTSTEQLNSLDSFFTEFSTTDFTLEVFTLNNDLVIEEHYSKQKARPYRGFQSGEWRGFEVEPQQEEFNRIKLYKLHGSLDWLRLTDSSIVERWKIDKSDETGIVGNIEYWKVDQDPFIIFGHGTKFFSIEPFFSLINNFKKQLTSRKYFFVIGYSFFDPYINNLMFQAILEAERENKKVIIVNPSFAIPPLDLEKHFKDNSNFKFFDTSNSEAKSILTEYLSTIQSNTFFSEIPEFNIKQIPIESIYYINMMAKEFMEFAFSNKGEQLMKLLEVFEQEKESELPFK